MTMTNPSPLYIKINNQDILSKKHHLILKPLKSDWKSLKSGKIVKLCDNEYNYLGQAIIDTVWYINFGFEKRKVVKMYTNFADLGNVDTFDEFYSLEAFALKFNDYANSDAVLDESSITPQNHIFVGFTLRNIVLNSTKEKIEDFFYQTKTFSSKIEYNKWVKSVNPMIVKIDNTFVFDNLITVTYHINHEAI